MGRFSVTAARVCDSTRWHRPPDHSGRAIHRGPEMPPRPAQWVLEPDTSARCWWNRGSGRSTRKPRRNSACREEAISHAEGCRGGGRSRKATSHQDSNGEDGDEILTYQTSALEFGEFSLCGAGLSLQGRDSSRPHRTTLPPRRISALQAEACATFSAT